MAYVPPPATPVSEYPTRAWLTKSEMARVQGWAITDEDIVASRTTSLFSFCNQTHAPKTRTRFSMISQVGNGVLIPQAGGVIFSDMLLTFATQYYLNSQPVHVSASIQQQHVSLIFNPKKRIVSASVIEKPSPAKKQKVDHH